MPIAQSEDLRAWRKSPHLGAVLNARFLGAPKSIDIKSRANGVDDLRALLTAAEAPKETCERALDEAAKDGGETITVWTVSNRAVDSFNTTFDPDGWDLESFKHNPVVLFAHQRDQLPIGRDIGAWVAPGRALKGVTRYTPESINPFGAQVGRAVAAGFLSAVSVGFDPSEWEVAEERDDGESFVVPVDFKKQRLLEYSVCPVPSNPEALHEGRTVKELVREAGIDVRMFVEWCERALDGEAVPSRGGLLIPRTMLEAARSRMLAIGDGIVLGPSTLTRAPGDVAPSDEVVPGGNLVDETDETDHGDEPMQCPACGYEGTSDEFSVETEPTGEEADAADGLSTRALLEALERRGQAPRLDSNDEAMQSQLEAIGEHATKVAMREAERIMTEQTGRLPGRG